MLSLLFEKRFGEYFSAFRADSPLWLFVHVPKTAGSSLRGELAQVMKPEANIFVDYSDPAKTYMERLDDAAAAFIARNRETPHRFASGHIFTQHVDAIEKAVGQIRCITMLRQPVKRVVSDYRYQCSPMHPGNEEFRRQFPTFRDYLQRQEECNKATRYLVPYGLLQSGDENACLDYIINRYDFLGLQEMYPLSFRMLFALVGEPKAPTLRMRVNEGSDQASLDSDPDLLQEIEAKNALDMAIHRALLAKWKVIRDPLLEYLASNATHLARA